jgi:ABC-2 type transport system permease protein
MKHIQTIIRKEWEDAMRNKMVFYVVVLVPLFMVILPIVLLYLMGHLPISESDMQELGRALNSPLFQGMQPEEAMQSVMTSNMLVLFLMMPIMVPVTIAAYSIVGEKVQRSLEPLLATPVSTTELLLGKGIAAALPGVLTTWIAYGIFLIFAWFLAASPRVFGIFINPMWLVALFVLAPLLTIMAVNFGLIISSRVSDPRSAEQLGALIVLPLMLLFIGGLSGFIPLDSRTFWVTSILVAVTDVVLVYFAVVLFQRETILTRWK